MRYKIITRIVCRLIRIVAILYAIILIVAGFKDIRSAFGNLAVCVILIGITTVLIGKSSDE